MWTFSVLGPTEAHDGDRRAGLGGPLPRRLLTALVAAEGRPVCDDRLGAAVWPGRPPAAPAAAIQVHVSRLRRAFGGEGRNLLRRTSGGYRLAVAPGTTDMECFAGHIDAGRKLSSAGRTAEAVREFDHALRLWRGEPFTDLAEVPTGQARLRELKESAEEDRLAALITTGAGARAVAELEGLVAAAPYRERRWAMLVRALYGCGRQADALAALRRVRDLLAEELGVDPGPELRGLERRVLAQDPALLLPERAPGPRQTAGGTGYPLLRERAVRSDQPLPLPQRAASRTDNPLPSGRRTGGSSPPGHGTGLPRPLSAFLGRDAELELLARLIAAHRLVTVVGPAGVGKTRLAVEHTTELSDPDGPWLVRLAALTDPAQIPSAIAAAMGLPPAYRPEKGTTTSGTPTPHPAPKTVPDPTSTPHPAERIAARAAATPPPEEIAAGARPGEGGAIGPGAARPDEAAHEPVSPGRSPRAPGSTAAAITVEALAEALGGRHGLLVLDTCEHLTGEALTALVHTLLCRVAGLRVLVTSRVPLGVDGERLVPLGPLPAGQAVALLVDRIRAVRPDWSPNAEQARDVRHVVSVLDGLPLALELAAARAGVLGVRELARLLHDRFAVLGAVPSGSLNPHPTWEAAIAWSFDLLPDAERSLVLRLWPHEGGFPLEAATAALPPGTGRSTVELLSSLVSRSVVVADTSSLPSRYRLLGSVRAYCRKLAEVSDPAPR